MYAGAVEKVFSRKTIRELSRGEWPIAISDELSSLMRQDGCSTLGEGFSHLFNILFKKHRCEYVYKSVLLNKIVFGRHSPRTSSAFEELAVGGSIADFVVINGKATVYEIKTDLDNLHRLDAQVMDYYSAFENVAVVCGSRNCEALVERYSSSSLGIILLTDRGRLSTIKEPDPVSSMLNHQAMFDILRKAEREKVLRELGIDPPQTSPIHHYEQCLKMFEEFSIDLACDKFLKVIKSRGLDVEGDAIRALPKELRVPGYFTGLSSFESERVRGQLSLPLPG